MPNNRGVVSKAVYVNVYDVEREYGGPEEGGWWYDTGHCIKSVRAKNEKHAALIREKLEERYPFTRKRYSVLGGEDFDVEVEKTPGAFFPKERPYYC